MFLKSLEIKGFKSFPDKTVLEFTDGITAVVGPNGSGKSNIADAVRWVLGEQSAKSLRGGKMEDVVFGGTQKRGSMGYASVSITIDNSAGLFDMEADEVVIGRKYYRSGESEYHINKNTVRMRDVHELLMDTGLGKDGYSMIGQGKIAEIVSSKSTERREIFEEAAGISKFRYHREQGERKLEQAAENLARLKDILIEIEARLAPLESSSRKASDFLELSTRKRRLEVAQIISGLEKSRERAREHENKFAINNANYGALDEKLAFIENENKEVYDNMNALSLKLEEIREEKRLLDEKIAQNEALLAVLQNDIFHKEESIKRLELEAVKISGFSDDIKGERNEKELKLEEIAIKKAEEIAAISVLEAELMLVLESAADGNSHLSKLNERFLKLSGEISTSVVEESKSHSLLTELLKNSGELEERKQMLAEQKARLAGEQAKTLAFHSELEKNLASAKNSLLGFDLKKNNKKEELLKQEKEREKLLFAYKEASQRAELLKNMDERMEDYPFSVKKILRAAKNHEIYGIRGSVASLIDAPREHTLAIETALGFAVQNIVVEDEEAAKAGIKLLKDSGAGRATFLPMTTIKPAFADTRSIENMGGYIGIAATLVKNKAEFDNIVSSLLGRTIVCDNIDNAALLAKACQHKLRIVTSDGQIINAGGSFTGGSQKRAGGILSRRAEIEELEESLKLIDVKGKDCKKSLDISMLEFEEIEKAYAAYQKNLGEIEEDLLKTGFELRHLNQQIAANKQTLDKAQKDSGINLARTSELEKIIALEKAKQAEFSVAKTKLDDEIRRHGLKKDDELLEREGLSSDIKDRRLALLSLEKDMEVLLLSIFEIDKRSQNEAVREEEIAAEMATILSEIEGIRKEIALKEEFSLSSKILQKTLDEATGEHMKKRENLEKGSSESRFKEREIMGEKELLSREMARLEELRNSESRSYDEMVARLWDEYELTVSEAAKEAMVTINHKEDERELIKIKNQIKNLGTVNLGAIEEFKEVKERYEFLDEQISDVENSRTELISIVHELTQSMEKTFADCFIKINEHFMIIFSELFGGGKASLSLSEPENILESGIEINVSPPGKVIRNLAALSGGEQAFVAIAIYFAILKVRPAPFCLLDEIEAALDEVNVSRYAAYLRRMCDKTQFIAITHRRGTMEEADVLYGVTMQEEGISKLLKLDITEALASISGEKIK